MDAATDRHTGTYRQTKTGIQTGRQVGSQSVRQANSQEGGRSDVTNKCGNTSVSVES